jgi:DNA-binding response OmpR family regulator
MFHILVVEDDASTRMLMCEVLKNAGYVPHEAADGLEALEVMDHQHIDLAVVDLMMPHMDGFAFTRTLRDGACDLPILMVTAMLSQADKRRGFEVGTDDYMVKPVDEQELLWRINALLRRARSASEKKLTVGRTILDYNAFQVSRDGQLTQLSPKEFQLLYKLLSYPKSLMTKRKLLDEIWDMDTEVDEHTVEVHIHRLREKFKDNPDFEIRTVRGFGYMGIVREDEP